jgi:hypothetical protein
MVVGQFGVELRPQATGVLKAFVSNAAGESVENANLEVTMQGADGQPHAVTLAWDATASAYLGTMPNTTPVAGAATVKVTQGEIVAEAEAPSVSVAATPVYGGHVVLVGDLAAEVRTEADGVVYVTAQRGDAFLGADGGVALKVNVTVEGGEQLEVPLAWDAPSAAYVAVLPEGTALTHGALELSATIDGVDYLAGLNEVSVSAPAHDGDVVAVGDMSVEVVPAADGKLEAYVVDASGAAITADANVTIEIAGMSTPTILAWDAASNCYKGEVAADVDVTTAPLVVAVEHRGRAQRGGLAVAAGRAFGVNWRARVASGAGGAIPPGQQMRLASNAEVRGRFAGSVAPPNVEGRTEVAVSAMAPRPPGAMVNVNANAEAARARAGAVNVQGQAAADRARAGGAAVQVSVMAPTPPPPPRPPAAPMVSAMAGAGAGASTEMGGASGSASVMIGF